MQAPELSTIAGLTSHTHNAIKESALWSHRLAVDFRSGSTRVQAAASQVRFQIPRGFGFARRVFLIHTVRIARNVPPLEIV